jgi:hypothetical protein
MLQVKDKKQKKPLDLKFTPAAMLFMAPRYMVALPREWENITQGEKRTPPPRLFGLAAKGD